VFLVVVVVVFREEPPCNRTVHLKGIQF